jgi:hypothetical protein
MLTCVVAGPLEVAVAAMRLHGITWESERQLNRKHSRPDSAFKGIPEDDRSKLAAWYGEDNGAGFPLPEGSLLIYSTHEETEDNA